MSDFDRELIDVISTLTDEGAQLSIRDAVEYFGSYLPRLVRDGFVAVFERPDGYRPDQRHRLPRHPPRYLSLEESVQLLSAEDVPASYRIGQAPGAVSLECQPNLVFRYAADQPDAVDEVRQLNAEGRASWEEQWR